MHVFDLFVSQQLFLNMWDCFCERRILVYPLRVVIMCFSDSWMLVGQLLEQLRNGTRLFPVRLV